MIYEDFDGGPNSLNSSQREFIRNQDNAEFGAPNKQNNDKQIRRDTLLEVAELLRNELWKGEPSGNPLKGWVSTSTGQRFTSLGSRIMFGKFLTQHNNQIDILISKLERMAGE
mgnify:CR=1 FL=1